MIKSIVFLCFLLVHIVYAVPDSECKEKSNTDCKSCLSIKGCAFCKDNKQCFAHAPTSLDSPCSKSNLQQLTCLGNTQVWLIALGSAAGAVLLIVIIVILCCRRKCAQRSRQKERKLDSVNNQRMDERKAAAEVRTAERNRANDTIRMKYGLLKEKDKNGDYSRMN